MVCSLGRGGHPGYPAPEPRRGGFQGVNSSRNGGASRVHEEEMIRVGSVEGQKPALTNTARS